jgi:heparosan-N-sulfate-glucuronate 5-epimerase
MRSFVAAAAVALACGCAPAANAAHYDPTGPYPALDDPTARTAGYQREGTYVDYGIGPGGGRFKSGLQIGLVLDREGIPKVRYRFGTFYNPAIVARQGLAVASAYIADHRFHTGRQLQRVRTIANWLVRNQDGGGRWLFRFGLSLPAVRTRVNAPWVSAMAQGMAMSLLTRAHRLTGDPIYLAAAERALAPFARDTRRGGVVADFRGRPWYEEYPSVRPTHVLNGFMFALLGLYDECRWVPQACRLFDTGMRSLHLRIRYFDRPRGSFYYPGAIPAGRAYHRLHVALLTALTSVRRVPALDAIRRRWASRL